MDTTLAQMLAKISFVVYFFDETQYPGIGIDDPGNVVRIVDDEDQTSVAAVLQYPDMTVLAFQGTITSILPGEIGGSGLDWGQNFEIDLLDTDQSDLRLPGKIHKGWANQLHLIKDKITAALAAPSTLPLYLTGHSQGGAIAVLATSWLKQQGYSVAATYTFAGPRPGNRAFALSVDTPVFRVEFGDDIVPHVPFPEPPGDLLRLVENPLTRPGLRGLLNAVSAEYAAVGTLTYRRLGTPLQNLSETEEQDLAAVRRGLLAAAGPAVIVENHAPFNYIAMFDHNLVASIARYAAEEAVIAARHAAKNLLRPIL